MYSMGLSESEMNSGNVIVDSGTTDTYFSRKFSAPFKKVWKQLTGKDYNHNSIHLTTEELEALPTIILVMSGFDSDPIGDESTGDPNKIAGYVGDNIQLSANPRDVVVAIPATHYMEFEPDDNAYTPRFYTEESSGSVLGANAMMGHDVYFDIARGRIGFAESNCDYVSLLMSEGRSISVPMPKTVSDHSAKGSFVEEILQDRRVVALFMLGIAAFVIVFIHKTVTRRRVVRQYQEAELEISAFGSDSDGDDNEENYMPQIT